MSRADVSYALERDVDAEEFIDVLVRSSLAEHRPVGKPETIRGMLEHADVIVAARSRGSSSASPGRSPTSAIARTCPTWRWTGPSSGRESARN